jgi:hypothetical protein
MCKDIYSEYVINDKQRVILDFYLKELKKYIKNYEFIFYNCPKTNLEHACIIFNFYKIDLSTISEECKTLWSLHNLQYIFDKEDDEFWRDGCFIRIGIPPIQRVIPKIISESIFENHTKYHHEGSILCFEKSY